MSRSQVVAPTLPTLVAQMGRYAGMPQSKQFTDHRESIRHRIARDYREGLLRGIDGKGRPMAPVKARRGAYAGKTGAPLVPFGTRSRFHRQYRSEWVRRGELWVLVESLADEGAIRDVANRFSRRGRARRAGAPFSRIALGHVTGAGRLPVRDPFGLRPDTAAAIKAQDQAFLAAYMRRFG